MDHREEILKKIDERNCFIKDRINRKQAEHIMDFLQIQSEIMKNNPFAPPQISFLSELSQKRLQEIQERTGKNNLPFNNNDPLSLIEKIRNYDDMENQLKLMKYIKRVNEEAGNKLLDDKDFADKFFNTQEFDAVILSVDIRRSTELMLRCDSPKIFAEFITLLAKEFESAVKSRYGVYDKFTGDGFLAFFPDFYSGKDALSEAIMCVADCKDIFDAVWEEYKAHFDMGDIQTGIGGGIDCGMVYAEGGDVEYSVVGKPVVYACRFSSAPAGHVYLTNNANNRLSKCGKSYFEVKETMVPIKHEQDMKAYDISLEKIDFDVVELLKPEWSL